MCGIPPRSTASLHAMLSVLSAASQSSSLSGVHAVRGLSLTLPMIDGSMRVGVVLTAKTLSTSLAGGLCGSTNRTGINPSRWVAADHSASACATVDSDKPVKDGAADRSTAIRRAKGFLWRRVMSQWPQRERRVQHGVRCRSAVVEPTFQSSSSS